MATIGGTKITLSDLLKTLDPDGSPARIAEILMRTESMLEDFSVMEANGITSHRSTQRVGLPTATARKLNQFVAPSKGAKAQVDDSIAEFTSNYEIDKSLWALNGFKDQWFVDNQKEHVQALSHKVADTIIYGNTNTAPEEFLGLQVRYNDLAAANADNIVTGGGAGSDNTSIWLVSSGPERTSLIFPKGSQAGIEMSPPRLETIRDSTGAVMEGYVGFFYWKTGLAVSDWRYVVRGANIDRSDLTPNAATGANLVNIMIDMMHLLPSDAGNMTFYVNRTIEAFLHKQVTNKANVWISRDEMKGSSGKMLTFEGIPVRRADAILNTEATVS